MAANSNENTNNENTNIPNVEFSGKVAGKSVPYKDVFHTDIATHSLFWNRVTIQTDQALNLGDEIQGKIIGEERINDKVSYPVLSDIHVLDLETAKKIHLNANQKEIKAIALGAGVAAVGLAAAGYEALKVHSLQKRERAERRELAELQAGVGRSSARSPARRAGGSRPLVGLLITAGILGAGYETLKHHLLDGIGNSSQSVDDTFAQKTKVYAKMAKAGVGLDAIQESMVSDAVIQGELDKRLSPAKLEMAKGDLRKAASSYAGLVEKQAWQIDDGNANMHDVENSAKDFEKAKILWGIASITKQSDAPPPQTMVRPAASKSATRPSV